MGNWWRVIFVGSSIIYFRNVAVDTLPQLISLNLRLLDLYGSNKNLDFTILTFVTNKSQWPHDHSAGVVVDFLFS